MRKLQIVPIVHSRQDLGSLDAPIQELKNKSISASALHSSRNAVETFWSQLRLAFESCALDFSQVLLYQDALPYTGQADQVIEHKIVRDLAARGSSNHQLLEWLIGRGASLKGTESTELLLKEYEAVRKSLADGFREFENSSDEDNYPSSLLAQRDQFIANRIATTLGEEQTGILFIGMLHRVESFFDGSIEIEYPFGKPKALAYP